MNSNGRDTILLVAERLIAERGLHGVSAREIVRTAGQRNNSAITYHFGSWDGLLESVWLEHIGTVNELRARMLDEIPDDAADRLDRLVAAYVHPFVAEISAHKPSYWARFNEQWLTGVHMDFVERPTTLLPEDARYPRIQGMDLLKGLFARIGAELAHLDPEARTRRVATTARFVVSALATWERESTTGIAPDLDAFEKELTALALALLLAP
ncbi:TetR family transcriptional regulator [Rhodococcus hoagii]|uniref:TetR/AcrR family transcriptional regulator n=1 Tax=Rhodococcus hoagii TaxID=43767 RepID=UPI000A0FD336|nr:helix-turn-helix domain-containing protein [Prescottella equi]MBU4613568.1 TetR/AcrR family transcriptional regulator [Rhodococcus sp. GG48]MBM4696306.1 TetR family transcriptional regulator [Prescottella equi]NKR33300.1 TetR family transcriptional regulator [Prescottella equi]NKS53086.1 TetR family transcriptional regulator [Prescottella equi]NKS57841.1 TetR family transcriptional regulator [Prescottella equi]